VRPRYYNAGPATSASQAPKNQALPFAKRFTCNLLRAESRSLFLSVKCVTKETAHAGIGGISKPVHSSVSTLIQNSAPENHRPVLLDLGLDPVNFLMPCVGLLLAQRLVRTYALNSKKNIGK